MSMMREEAIELLNEQYETCKRIYDCSADQRKSYPNVPQFMEALGMALTALRPVTREQVEKVRGEWIDIDGEKVPVDKYGQPFGWAKCSACGEYLTASDEYPCIGHFCPNCGAPMTDEAVDMVMERLEALGYGKDD